jgi:TonB family protein
MKLWMRTAIRAWPIVLCLLLPGILPAADRSTLTLDVTGELGIDQRGAVYECKIDTMLTPEVKQVVETAMRQWKFAPVLRDGKPVYARTGVRMALLAEPVDNGYRLRIDKLRFIGSREARQMVPPRYPRDAMRVGIGARVLVAMRIDAAGRVLDTAAVESALIGVRGSERVQAAWRKRFEKSSVEAAQQWQFQPADTAAGDAPETTIIVPVTYYVGERGDNPAAHDGWRTGNITASHPIPWLTAAGQVYDTTGLRDGESLVVGNPIRLLDSVEGKTL